MTQAKPVSLSLSTPTFPKLNGMENYQSWKFAMEMHLTQDQLWKCVVPEVDKDGVVTAVDPELDKMCRARISLMVEPECYPHCMSARTARDLWDNLQKAYAQKGLSRRLKLLTLRLLFSITLGGVCGGSMQGYISKMMMISRQLTDIDFPIDDEFLAVIMLSGLPTSFDSMVMALESSNVKVTSDEVKGKLLAESAKTDTIAPIMEAAMFVQDPSKKKGKCFKCGKYGHYQATCPKRGNGNEPRALLCTLENSVEQTEHDKESSPEFAMRVETSSVSGEWIVDSGATSHMTNVKNSLNNFSEMKGGMNVTCADNGKLTTEGQGDVIVKAEESGDMKVIKNAIYVPNLSTNLLSVSQMVDNDLIVVFSKKGCRIFDEKSCKIQGYPEITALRSGGLFKLDIEPWPREYAFSAVSGSQELWHRRLGHINEAALTNLKETATGISFGQVSTPRDPCVPCLKGKMHRKPSSKPGERAREKLELVHSDLAGPMPEPSTDGVRFMLILVDDHNRKVFSYFLKQKNEVQVKLKQFKAKVEKETGKVIKVLRTDNGSEYCDHHMQSFLADQGIQHQTTIPSTPEQNGVAERTIRSICETARSLMMDSGCPRRLWAEACKTAVYLKNRTPHSANMGLVPEMMWTGKGIDLSHLKLFGCRAFVHVPKEHRTKWDSKARECHFIGYCPDTKGYLLMDTRSGAFVKGRDVVFLENVMWRDKTESSLEHREKWYALLPGEDGQQPHTSPPPQNQLADDGQPLIVEVIPAAAQEGEEMHVEAIVPSGDNVDKARIVVDQVQPYDQH